MPDGGALAAWLGARAARRALGEAGRAPTWLIRVVKRIAIIDLQWATRSLGLPAWDGPSWQDV
jgi:hypothetical protein